MRNTDSKIKNQSRELLCSHDSIWIPRRYQVHSYSQPGEPRAGIHKLMENRGLGTIESGRLLVKTESNIYVVNLLRRRDRTLESSIRGTQYVFRLVRNVKSESVRLSY